MFGWIYKLFQGFFGEKLYNYLYGYDELTRTNTGIEQFTTIGIITVAVSLVFILLYYYVINYPRFNRWWSWLIMLVITGLVNLSIAVGFVAITFSSDKGEYIMENFVENIEADNQNNGETDLQEENTKEIIETFDEIVKPIIGTTEKIGFGLANFIISTFWFIVFTFCFKWRSRNCKYSPF